MHKILRLKLSRRAILKAGTISLALSALPFGISNSLAQTPNPPLPNGGSPKPTGLIAFNAGWMIPVEDQKALLALEDKKKEEAKALAPQSSPAQQPNAAPVEAAKPPKKTWTEKLQDSWKQVRSFF